MRLGGLFPFSPTQIIEGGGMIELAAGGTFYPPAGNYILNLGSVTALQVWNPLAQAWMGAGTGYQALDTDGGNWRLINLSGTIQGANITNAGSGATNGIGATATGVTITFAAPATPGITATAYPIVGGSVAAPTITQAGTGWGLAPPLVVIDPPPFGGIQATATATLNTTGGVSAITMVNVGAGYVTTPNFYLIPQLASYPGGPTAGGAVAAGVVPPVGLVAPSNTPPSVAPIFTALASNTLLTPNALTGSGTLTGIVMILNGSNYTGTTIPAITITGAGTAAATALGFFVMTGSSALVGGAGYTGTAPIFETSLGLVSLTYNNNVLQPRAARGVATVAAGAVTGLTIEDQGFGFQKVPTGLVINVGSIAGTQATFTPTVGGVNDISTIQARINS